MAQTSQGTASGSSHQTVRLSVDTRSPFQEFRQQYESAVPPLDGARVEALKQRQAPWEDFIQEAGRNAPHGFNIFWQTDAGSLMRLAGDTAHSVVYLMGNYTIAERMYRHDPRVMLYAPLRTTIHEDRDGRTWFSADQPSSHFASFGVPGIAEVGAELDRKLASLMTVLGIPVPPGLA
jgi:hypothetical protein